MRSFSRVWTAAALLALLLLLVGAGGAAAGGSSDRGLTLDGEQCDLLEPADAASPLGGGSCPGVRPGALVETVRRDESFFCTLAFLFRGSDKRRYIATAGHCAIGEDAFDADAGERHWDGAKRGPLARDAEGSRIGRYVYAILDDPKDFALIRLRRKVAANPAMCHFGGPTGINADQTAGRVTLHFYGNGAVAGSVTPARTLTAFSMEDPDHVFADGPAAPGDSGAGVISDDGRAVGVLVTVGVHGGGSEDPGTVGITRLPPQLERAEEVLEVDLRLRTAPPA